MKDGQELVEAPTTGLSVFNEFEADLMAFEAADAEKEFDVSTSDGYAECKAYHGKLRKVYNGTDKLRKKENDSAQVEIKARNADAKKLLDRVDAMANPRKAMMEAEDAKLQAEIDRIAKEVEAKAEYEADENLAWLEYREKKAQAIIDAADKVELEAKEETERVEREKKIEAGKLEAAEKARKDAEAKSKKEKQDILDKAEEEKKAIVDKAEKAAKKIEDDRIDKELKEKKKQDKLDEAERVRVANKKHRASVEAEALTVISRIVEMRPDPLETSILLLAQIIDGAIPHIEIKY